MLRWSRWDDDRGSASLELLVGGLVMLVPVAYVVIACGEVQHDALAVETIARQAANAFARTGNEAETIERVRQTITAVAAEYDVALEDLHVSISCDAPVVGCPEPGAVVTVTIATDVGLPFLPDVFGLDGFTSVPVEATAVQKVSRFWGEP